MFMCFGCYFCLVCFGLIWYCLFGLVWLTALMVAVVCFGLAADVAVVLLVLGWVWCSWF